MKNSYSQKILNLSFYLFPLCTLLIWWTLAFKYQDFHSSTTSLPSSSTHQEIPPVIKYLSPLQRETLHQALNGDYPLMVKLITDWDHDAQMIEQLGFEDIKRLSPKDFLRCQLLARQIEKSSPDELETLENYHRWSSLRDDNHQLFDLTKTYRCFLPQSYVAASFLLALCEPESIIALPKGMREQTTIYPSPITQLITLDADRYNTEKLYAAKPDIAFVADYSHPSTIEALKKQGIPLFTLNQVNSPEDIQHALVRVGHMVNKPLEAELLNYFVEASMHAIDNRFKIIHETFNATQSQPKILFLKHHLTFSTPTSRTLTGQLLKKMGVRQLIGDLTQNKRAWTVPIRQEQIQQINPDYIIVGTHSLEGSKKSLFTSPLFCHLRETGGKKIIFVDDGIQESPSQYMVLAYYDLFKALAGIDLP